MNQNQLRLRFLVSGRVQGVGYRRFVEREALLLKLRGFARNLADGRVEVQAEGPPNEIGLLRELLRKGPPFSTVENVAEEPLADTEAFTHFEVRPDAGGGAHR